MSLLRAVARPTFPTDAMSRKQNLHAAIAAALAPTYLDVIDESSMHSRGAESHMRVIVVSAAFDGVARVQRHRRVHEAAQAVFADGLHALAVEAATPAEWERRGQAARLDAPACQGGARHDAAHKPGVM
jgi:BolA protein